MPKYDSAAGLSRLYHIYPVSFRYNLGLAPVICRPPPTTHDPVMFAVNEAEAAAIRAAFHEGGELSATVELRRLFPGLADNENARRCTQAIAGWQPSLPPPPKKPRTCRTKLSTR